MKTTQQIIACLFFLALSVKEGLSTGLSTFECYSCNSFSDDNCLVVGPKTPKAPCGANETMCRKVEQYVYYNKADHVRVFRQCAKRGTPGTCDSRTGTYRFKSWYCHCSGPNCNGSGSLFTSILLTVTMIAASMGLGHL